MLPTVERAPEYLVVILDDFGHIYDLNRVELVFSKLKILFRK